MNRLKSNKDLFDENGQAETENLRQRKVFSPQKRAPQGKGIMYVAGCFFDF